MRIVSWEGGFGLVETLIAVAILGTALVAGVAALSTGALSVRVAGQDATAQSLARTNLEEIKAAPYAQNYVAVGEAGYDVSVDVSPVSGNITGIQKITVTVSREAATLFMVEGYKVNR